MGVPASADIPVTHRGCSTAFAVVTGHEAPDKATSSTDWTALARIPTLIVLMGVKNAALIAQVLMDAGRAGDTPAAVIQQGATSAQKVICSTLQELPQAIIAHGIMSPAVIVIGEVVQL